MSEFTPRATEPETQKVPLFDYEDFLSDTEIEAFWLDAMHEVKSQSEILYTGFTADDVIEHTAKTVGLKIPPNNSLFYRPLFIKAHTIKWDEQQALEDEHQRRYTLYESDPQLDTIELMRRQEQ